MEKLRIGKSHNQLMGYIFDLALSTIPFFSDDTRLHFTLRNYTKLHETSLKMCVYSLFSLVQKFSRVEFKDFFLVEVRLDFLVERRGDNDLVVCFVVCTSTL